MKRNLLKIVIVCLAVVAFVSCKDANTPEAVVEEYLKHVDNLDWDKAKKVSTKESHEMLDFMKGMMAMVSEEDLAEKEDMNIESIDCEIDGEKCTCVVVVNGEEDKLDLKLVDGKWLVHQTKEMGDDMDWDDDWEDDFDWDDEWEDDFDWDEDIDWEEDIVEEVIE